MKKIILLITILIISCNQPKSTKPIGPKYRIEFGNDCEVTNEITYAADGCIIYYYRGHEITRCGSYSIVKLK